MVDFLYRAFAKAQLQRHGEEEACLAKTWWSTSAPSAPPVCRTDGRCVVSGDVGPAAFRKICDLVFHPSDARCPWARCFLLTVTWLEVIASRLGGHAQVDLTPWLLLCLSHDGRAVVFRCGPWGCLGRKNMFLRIQMFTVKAGKHLALLMSQVAPALSLS